jgi:hypothetical protein
MASCQPKVPEVRYCDESWWQDFFTKDLAEFYASLNGLRRAREALLKELSGDLAQVLADPQRRDLALRVLFGGLDEACLEKIRGGDYSYRYGCDIDCIKADTAAHFYKYMLGIGLGKWGRGILGYYYDEDLEERTRLLNLLNKEKKEKLGISINGYDTGMIMEYLSELNKIVDDIYSNPRIQQAIPVQQVRQVRVDYGLDLVKAFEDFLNKSIKLLPLYNPFTFFIQSLRSTPRPYLNIMYGEDLFSDSVRNLMSKYGVELTKILDPGLNVQPEDDELAVIGHKEGSIGKLIDELVRKIYDMTSMLNSSRYLASNEYEKYIMAKYNEKTSAGYTLKELIATPEAKSEYRKFCYSYGRLTIKVKNGVFKAYQTKYPYDEVMSIKYERFLELLSPLLFLGVAWIEGDELHFESWIEGDELHEMCLGG